MAPPLSMQTVMLGSQAVRFAVGGASDAARTLLLFNGIGASVETAAPFIAGFKHMRVIAFDAPGVGESPAPALPYRLRHRRAAGGPAARPPGREGRRCVRCVVGRRRGAGVRDPLSAALFAR